MASFDTKAKPQVSSNTEGNVATFELPSATREVSPNHPKEDILTTKDLAVLNKIGRLLDAIHSMESHEFTPYNEDISCLISELRRAQPENGLSQAGTVLLGEHADELIYKLNSAEESIDRIEGQIARGSLAEAHWQGRCLTKSARAEGMARELNAILGKDSPSNLCKQLVDMLPRIQRAYQQVPAEIFGD